MHYETTGTGEKVLVFIHGFGGFGGLWHWQVEHFESRARVITVDLPGHGRTPWTPLGLQEMADQLREVLDRAGVARAHLIVNSFGGLVALQFLERLPQRALTVSFVGSPPRFTASGDFPGGLTVPGIRKLGRQLEGDVGKVLDMFVRSFSTSSERAMPQYARVRELRGRAPLPDRQALLAFLDILETADLRDVLRRVDIPVQFINGDSDYICPLSVINVLRQDLPQARFDIFKGAGHGFFVTMPDECNKVLAEFIGL